MSTHSVMDTTSKTFSDAIVLTSKQAKIARNIVGRAFLH